MTSPKLETSSGFAPNLVTGILAREAPAKWTKNPTYQAPEVVAELRRAIEGVRFENPDRTLELAAELVELVHQVPVGAKTTPAGKAYFPSQESQRQELALALALLAEIQVMTDQIEDALSNFHRAAEHAENLDPGVQATVIMRVGASRLRLRGTVDPLGTPDEPSPGYTLEKALALFEQSGSTPAEIHLLLGAACSLIDERIHWLQKALQGPFEGYADDLANRIRGEARRRLVQELFFYPGLRLPVYLDGHADLASGAAEDALLVGFFHLRSERTHAALEILKVLDLEALKESYHPWHALGLGETFIRLGRPQEAEPHLETARRLTALNDLLGQMRSEWLDGGGEDTLRVAYTEVLGWAARLRARLLVPLYPLGLGFVPWQDCVCFLNVIHPNETGRHLQRDEALHLSAGEMSADQRAFKTIEADIAAVLSVHSKSLGFGSVVVEPDDQGPYDLSIVIDVPGDDVMRCTLIFNYNPKHESQEFLAEVGVYLPVISVPGYGLALAAIDLALIPTSRRRDGFYPEPGFPTTWQDGAVEACAAAEIRKRWPYVGHWFSRRLEHPSNRRQSS